ncbi:MAG: hypothetical protein ACD_76C00125G0004 [uncultured bacterium]|nr:MAG: hypothetical protein ACD_76C00125G0004 [uncultured bacterium]HBD05493.1 diacylglycerol kinase [Candidatus Uhrbacteria bacterium]
MSIKAFIKSLKHALRGVKVLFRDEQSFRIQSVIGAIVAVAAFVLPLAPWETILLLLLVGLVLVLEMLNSIFERIVDMLKARLHPVVGEIKDIMAGTVLFASILALIIGLLVLVPNIIEMVL